MAVNFGFLVYIGGFSIYIFFFNSLFSCMCDGNLERILMLDHLTDLDLGQEEVRGCTFRIQFFILFPFQFCFNQVWCHDLTFFCFFWNYCLEECTKCPTWTVYPIFIWVLLKKKCHCQWRLLLFMLCLVFDEKRRGWSDGSKAKCMGHLTFFRKKRAGSCNLEVQEEVKWRRGSYSCSMLAFSIHPKLDRNEEAC